MRKNLGFVCLPLALMLACGTLAACNAGTEKDSVLTLLAVNDLHGKFMDTDTQPGLDEFTTYLKELYADDTREEILLSSGDMWQGTAESSSTRGALMTEWMNEAGFCAMTLGNHEFDWGTEAISSNAELAEFPILALNVEYNGAPAPFCEPSVTVEKGGMKVGIIGAIGDCLSSISGEYQTGLYFETGSELTALVKSEATRLRTEEGCDFIVYSIHDGGSGFSRTGVNNVTDGDLAWYDTSLSDGYVDLVFEGHTHQQYIAKDEYGVYHLQASSENRAIARADISPDGHGGYSVTPRIVPSSEYAAGSIVDDPVVDELFEQYFEGNDPYKTALGENVSRWDSDDIADKVAELYYKKGKEVWGSEYDIVLGGGYLKTRNPYDLARGNVTYADIFSLLPFDNSIVLGSIKGRYLKSNFLTYKQNYHSYPIGTTLSPGDFDDDGTYYIVVDSYTSTYAPNHITEVKRLEGNIYARDLLADYIKDGRRAP